MGVDGLFVICGFVCVPQKSRASRMNFLKEGLVIQRVSVCLRIRCTISVIRWRVDVDIPLLGKLSCARRFTAPPIHQVQATYKAMGKHVNEKFADTLKVRQTSRTSGRFRWSALIWISLLINKVEISPLVHLHYGNHS